MTDRDAYFPISRHWCAHTRAQNPLIIGNTRLYPSSVIRDARAVARRRKMREVADAYDAANQPTLTNVDARTPLGGAA